MGPALLGLTLAGRYKIVGHIGEGAMASVFSGQDLESAGAPVAIKVMHPHLANDRTFSARFKREAQAASMVKHPNSVAIHAIGEENGIHYLIMELCPGRDLRETLKIVGRLPALRAVRILRAVADALRVAHELGVIHRDLKPENVMVQLDPQTGLDWVKVLDFGIAKLVAPMPKLRSGPTDSDPAPAITQFGVVVGTPQYMSPEQVRGHNLDGRSDLYTCGVLLYQMVTGVLPFDGESPLEVAGRHAFEIPKSPRSVFPELDPSLDALTMRLLAKQPEERPQSAAELADLLTVWERNAIGPVGSQGVGLTAPLEAAGRRGPFQPLAATAQDVRAPSGVRPQLGTQLEIGGPPVEVSVVAPMPATPHPAPAPIAGGVAPGGVSATPPRTELPTAASRGRGFGALGWILLALCAMLGSGLGFTLHLVCTRELFAPDESAPEGAEPLGPPYGIPLCE
jgi:eukaryotic-like serine/threonine-protein kinase